MVGCLTIMMDVKDSSVVRAAKGGVPGNVTAYDSNQIARKQRRVRQIPVDPTTVSYTHLTLPTKA